MQSKSELGALAWEDYLILANQAQKLGIKAQDSAPSDRLRFREASEYLADWADQKLRRKVYDIFGPFHNLWILRIENEPIAGRVFDPRHKTVADLGKSFDYHRFSVNTWDNDDDYAKTEISPTSGESLERKAIELLREPI